MGGAGREQPIPSPQHCLCLGPLSGAHRTAGNGRLAPRRGGFPRPPSCLFVCCCVGRGPRRSASRPVGPVPKAIWEGKGPVRGARERGSTRCSPVRSVGSVPAPGERAKEKEAFEGRKEMAPNEESRPTTIVKLGARGRGGIVGRRSSRRVPLPPSFQLQLLLRQRQAVLCLLSSTLFGTRRRDKNV